MVEGLGSASFASHRGDDKPGGGRRAPLLRDVAVSFELEQDFRLEAINASLKNPQCGELGIRFIRGLLAALPEEEERLEITGDLAMLYFNLQRDAEAEDCCQKLIRDHPDRATGYVHLSDGLLRDSFRCAPDPTRIGRAIDLL